MNVSAARDERIRRLWLERPEEKRCVLDIMLFEEILEATEPQLLEGVQEKYKFLMQVLWEHIIDKS